MFEQKLEAWYKKTGKNILYLVLTAAVIYLTIKWHIYKLLAPFIAAWLLTALIHPVVTWLNEKFKLPRAFGTIVSMLTILSAAGCFAALLIKQLCYQVTAFINYFPYYSEAFLIELHTVRTQAANLLGMTPETGIFNHLDQLEKQLVSGTGTFLTTALPNVYSMISQIPDVIIFVIVTLIATFFMTKDYFFIRRFIKAQLSERVADNLSLVQRGMLGVFGGYVKTQLILMMITFGISLTGLLLFETHYALLISSIIALLDALPVFGSGTIFVPWIIYKLVTGNYIIAVGLLGIYGIIFIVRQVMEPKILSQQIGFSALVTVMAMYIGYKTMGVLGLIAGPVILVAVTTLQSVGVLPKFHPVEYQEDERNINENGTI